MKTEKSNQTGTPADIEPIQVRRFSGKKIHQYGLDGKYIRSFDSISQAQKELGIKGVGLYRVIQGKAKSCHGFQFRLAE
jgi:hypothetical protein